MNRLQTLFNRRERLIEANLKQGFVRSQPYRYLNILRLIRNEIKLEQLRLQKENVDHSFSEFLQATKGMNGSQILILTNKYESRKETKSQGECF